MPQTHLNVSLATLNNGVPIDMLGKFRAIGLDPEVVTADSRAVAQRYGNEVPVKKRMPFTIEELVTAANGRRQTNLNVTVFSIGGTDVLFRLRGGSMAIETQTDEVSGVNDEWEYEVATGTTFSLDSNYRVDLNPAFVQTAIDGADADLEVIGLVNLGGISATLPLLIKGGSLKIDVLKAQMESCTMVNRGEPSAVSGNPVVASILAGTAAFGYAFRTSPGAAGAKVEGNCLCKSTRLSFDNASLIAASHSFVAVGQPTVTRAA